MALARHPVVTYPPVRGNIDRDSFRERVVIQDVGDQQRHPPRFAWRAMLQDRCGGIRRLYQLTAAFPTVDTYRIVEADGLRGRREVFVHLGGGRGFAGIFRLQPQPRGRCALPARIFGFAPAHPEIHWFTISVGNLSAAFPGLEVRVTEMMELERRTTYYRYSREAGRYVPYRTIAPPA